MKILAVSGKPDLFIDEMICLSEKTKPKVLIVPTASGDTLYDKYEHLFLESQCKIESLCLIRDSLTQAEIHNKIVNSDIIFVGGGKPDRLMRYWRRQHVERPLKIAAQNGTVLTGVSAGTMCWFRAGLSTARNSPVLFRIPLHYIDELDTGGKYIIENPGKKLSPALFREFEKQGERPPKACAYVRRGREWSLFDHRNPSGPTRFSIRRVDKTLEVRRKDRFHRIYGLNFIDAFCVVHHDKKSPNYQLKASATERILQIDGGIAIQMEDACAIEVNDSSVRVLSTQDDNVYKSYIVDGRSKQECILSSKESLLLSDLLNLGQPKT